MTNPISSITEMQLIRSAEKIVAPLIQEGVFEDFERALRALLLDYIDKQINKYWTINTEFETRFKQKFDPYTASLKNTATPSQEEEWMDWESAVILLGKWQKIREQVKIMALLDKLLLLMQATPELSEIEVIENETVDFETFNFKVRAIINPNALQIRFLADKDFNRYSFQLYDDKPILRWDNTPHYPKISTHPHRFHNQDDNVLPSTLTGNLLSDYKIVISEIRKYLKNKKPKK